MSADLGAVQHHECLSSPGLDERFNQILQQQLLKFVDEEQSGISILMQFFSHIEYLDRIQQTIHDLYWCMAANQSFQLNLLCTWQKRIQKPVLTEIVKRKMVRLNQIWMSTFR